MMNPNMMSSVGVPSGMPHHNMGASAMVGMPSNMGAGMLGGGMGMLGAGSSGKRKADGTEDRESKRKGRKKGFVWSHVTIDEASQKVCCLHCGENIKINFGEKVERLRKHFIKSCPKSPFQADSKEYEELLECISSPPIEQKKKSFAAGKAKNSNKVICYNIDFVNSILSGSFTMLTAEQIAQLEAQGNRSSNWGGVKLLCPTGVSFDSSLDKIRGCFFSGNIFIGLFVKTTMLQGGISVQAGLYNSSFSGNCVLSDNCYVWNTAMLMNVFVGRNTCVVGCGNVIGEGHTAFGTQRSITVGPEAAVAVGPAASGVPADVQRRSVLLNVKSTYADICGGLLQRNGGSSKASGDHGDDLGGSSSGGGAVSTASAAMGIVPGKAAKRTKYNRNDSHVRYDMTIICDDVEVSQCAYIRNCFVGSYCTLRDSSLNSTTILAHGEVLSSQLTETVMHQSCKINGGAQLNGVLMFPHSSVTMKAAVSECVLGPDASVGMGECKNSLLGPHVGFHHQALLIAACWPLGRGNVGYGGMVGANHTGRSNDQEAFLGEGCFFGLGCAIKYPSNLLQSPYSMIAAATTCPPQKIAFPFSLISTPEQPYPAAANAAAASAAGGAQLTLTMCTLRPGWILSANPYFLERSMAKYTRRRRSVDYRTDLPIFRPAIADMVIDARNRLLKFKESEGEGHGRLLGGAALQGAHLTERHISGAGHCVVHGPDVDAAIDAYTQFIHRYALHGLLFLIALAPELPSMIVAQPAEQTAPAVAALDGIYEDVRAMQSGLPAMGDHLHQLALGSSAPPASSSAKVAASVSSKAEPAASEISSPGAKLLLGTGSASSCCLLTDTHNPTVRAHQLRVLSEEFPDVDFVVFLQSKAQGILTGHDAKVKQLLKYLSELEQAYSEKVKSCKQKDNDRCAQIHPDFGDASSSAEDEAIAAARSRSGEIARCVQLLA